MSRIYNLHGEDTTGNSWYFRSNPGAYERLKQVLDQWHEEHRKQFVRDGYTNLLDSFDQREEKHAHLGDKYIRLDVGGSGAWMLELATGDVYQIKGYGKVDKKKCVGNIYDPTFDGASLFKYRFQHGRFDFRKKAS
jgi:hypothetical protein